jgi:hypothetical protein
MTGWRLLTSVLGELARPRPVLPLVVQSGSQLGAGRDARMSRGAEVSVRRASEMTGETRAIWVGWVSRFGLPLIGVVFPKTDRSLGLTLSLPFVRPPQRD